MSHSRQRRCLPMTSITRVLRGPCASDVSLAHGRGPDAQGDRGALRRQPKPSTPDNQRLCPRDDRPADPVQLSRRQPRSDAEAAPDPDRAPRPLKGAGALRCRTSPRTACGTYISITLLANNFDVTWVMSQVGHADSHMTLDVYAQLEQRIQRDHGPRFDRLIATAETSSAREASLA